MPRNLAAPILLVLLMLAVPRPAWAFDYLEHLWFTDDACRRVQDELAAQPIIGEQKVRAYLALALACPVRWEQPYCTTRHKQATGHLNLAPRLGAYSATLGDYSALADHVSRQGPIKHVPRAGRRGLVHETLEWLADGERGVGGVIGDVAEDACETKGRADIQGVTRDIDETTTKWFAAGAMPDVPRAWLGSLAHSAVQRGPHDPPMKYSFDNPHYLDLVLRNHHHFGDDAHDTWNGFHGTALQMRARTCAEIIDVDADTAEDLADTIDGYEKVDWDDYGPDELPERVCGMLGEVVRSRLLTWAEAAPTDRVEPVQSVLDRLEDDDPKLVIANAAIIDGVLVDLLSLVFEGTGLHYLQDGLASGHMRTIRSREALVEVRHDHDADNRDGVAAVMRTMTGTTSFVAWGDGYLLGKPPTPTCDPGATEPPAVTTCLLRNQRGIISAGSQASLADWVLGGVAYDEAVKCDGPLGRRVCVGLPTSAPRIAGRPQPDVSTVRLQPGVLPVPPPPFSFESLSLALQYAPWEQTPSLALRLATFAELDIPAHWMTSWQFRMESALGPEPADQSLVTDVGFGFHYRFYARVMLDLVPVAFAGLRDFGNGVDVFAGLAPRAGFTFLPEGWVKIPIEFTLYADYPLVFASTKGGFFDEVADRLPRAGLGFGLAFMH